VHSAFVIIFPLHILYLVIFKKESTRALVSGLSTAITIHISPTQEHSRANLSAPFPLRQFLGLGLGLTIAYALPGLLWFAAVSLSSVSDITALWNTNAFFAYVFTVKLFQLKWEARKLMAVLLATVGVAVVVYGGSTSSQPGRTLPEPAVVKERKSTAPVLGDLLTLLASVIYGLYQVLYKKYVALQSDPELLSGGLYERINSINENSPEEVAHPEEVVYPPPFGLHPNLFTSLIGLFTLLVLWIPLPLLHYFDLEPFSFPTNRETFFTIAGIAASGVFFNAGFMILLGIWGPIIASVGSLLTIVLVMFSDVILGGATILTVWSLIGAGVIVAAFGVLAYDMFA